MKNQFILLSFLSIFLTVNTWAQDRQNVVDATNEFLSCLSANEKEQVMFSFNDSLRTKWSNLPLPMVKRHGIRQGDLSDECRIKLQAVLRSFMSSQGYLKSNLIIRYDDYLPEYYDWAHRQGHLDDEQIKAFRKALYGNGNYFVAIFGKPSTDRDWSFRFGGHHLSINMTMSDKNISVTPTFMGIDPPELHYGPYSGFRPFGKEEEYGLRLFNSLSPAQQKKAIFTDKEIRDVITLPNGPQRIDEMQGISAKELNNVQQEYLRDICREFFCNYEKDKCEFYQSKYEGTAINKLYFGWAGGNADNTVHYYIVNGPDFTIEFDDAGWFFPGDHIHTIIRDKHNDFNEDVLRGHYMNSDHHHHGDKAHKH